MASKRPIDEAGMTDTTAARSLEHGSNIGWQITVVPSSNADVTVTLSATTDCSAQGAVRTHDGKMLSNELELTVRGREGR